MSRGWSRWLSALSMLVSLAASAARAAEPDRATLARSALDRAERAMLSKDFVAAAQAMEDAFSFDPNPLWLGNAGYAHMMAGQQDRAVDSLSMALADPRLQDDPRAKAVARLARASAARAHVSQAVAASARGDFVSAAQAYDRAFEQVALAAYVLESAILWEQAGNLDMAQQRYEVAAARDGLTTQQRRHVAEALPRIAALRERSAVRPPPVAPASPPPESTETATAGWILVASGVAVTGLGVAGFLLSDAEEQAFYKEAFNTEGELLMSGDEIDAREATATRWLNVGVIGAIVGGAALATGVVLVLVGDGPGSNAEVRVTAGPQAGGGFISAQGSF